MLVTIVRKIQASLVLVLRFKQTALLIATLSLGLHSHSVANQLDNLPTQEEILRQILPSQQANQAMLNAINPANYSLAEYLLEASLLSADELIASLRQRLATQIYAGSLLGAEGALLSHAGNAWDQAFLLQQALEASGADVRLVYTELSAANRNAYLNAAEHPQFSLDEHSRTALAHALPAFLGDEAEVEKISEILNHGYPHSEIPTQFSTIAANIRAAAGDSFPDGSRLLARLHEEITPYIWVQYRQQSHSPWQDVHLAFEPVEQIVATQLFDDLRDSLDYQHHISFNVALETLDSNGAFAYLPLLERISFNSNERLRQPFDLIIIGSSQVKGGGDLHNERLFYTLHGDSMDINGNLFTTSGTILDPWAVKNDPYGMVDLFVTTGGALEEAGGLLGRELSLGSDDASASQVQHTTATGVVLTLEYEPPFDSDRGFEQKRYLVDRLGVEARAKQDYSQVAAPYVFNGHWTLHSLIDRASPSELLYRLAERIEKYYAGELTIKQNAFLSVYLSNLYLRSSDALYWRGEPMLILNREKFSASTDAQIANGEVNVEIGTDIIHSGLRAARIERGVFQPDTELALIGGIYETYAEYYLMQGARTALNQLIMDHSAWESLASTTYDLTSMGNFDEKQISAWVKNNIEREFERGYGVVLNNQGNAWWRIDLDSGVVTGIDEYGQGGVVTEYLNKVAVIVSLAFTAYAMWDCTELSGAQAGCCVITNGIMSLLGFVIPYLFALKYGVHSTGAIAASSLFNSIDAHSVVDLGLPVGLVCGYEKLAPKFPELGEQ